MHAPLHPGLNRVLRGREGSAQRSFASLAMPAQDYAAVSLTCKPCATHSQPLAWAIVGALFSCLIMLCNLGSYQDFVLAKPYYA